MTYKGWKHVALRKHVLQFEDFKRIFLCLCVLVATGHCEVPKDTYSISSTTCKEHSTCYPPGVATPREFLADRGCQCDDQCFKYGDCCKDSEHYRPSGLSACVQVGSWNILDNDRDASYYMVETCQPSWLNINIRQKCEQYLETIKKEPLTGHPITSNATNITYVNYYCAMCNNDLNIKTMVRWKLQVICGASLNVPLPHIDDVLMNASFINATGKIKPKFSAEYHTCKLYLWRPRSLLRPCEKDIIDYCPRLYQNDTVKNLCEESTSIVYYKKFQPYRNPYCALCNKKMEKSLYCYTDRPVLESFLPLLFDVSGEGGVGKRCAHQDEAYDPRAQKCRHVIWSMAGCQGNNCNFFNCTKLVLDPDEFEINDDFTGVDKLSGKIYQRDGFTVNKDGHVEICVEYEVTTEKFSVAMKFVTFFGLGVSVLSLILHLLAFAVNPVLRNLSGKNLASLCAALLLAYISFITGQFVQPGGITCVVSAMVTYYGFLSSFLWLLMMAYDVWRTLRLSTVHLRVVSRERRWRLFLVYTVISWLLVPGTFVASATVMQIQERHHTYWPGFGNGVCWFGNRKALLIFFVVPVAIVMSLNVILYSLSTYMICATSVSPSNKSSDEKKNYKLFARLAVLMGLTWISGFIAAYMDMEAIWYIFILLNAFQGLFIFIAFTLTRRVRSGIISQISGDSKTTRDSSSSCWSWNQKLKRTKTRQTRN